MGLPHFMAIVGPTASGKTALSLEVGRRLSAEIISMDSRQIYRGMDMGREGDPPGAGSHPPSRSGPAGPG